MLGEIRNSMNRRRNKSLRVPYGGVYSIEDLPSPIVHYPWSGPWIEFQKDECSQPLFCSCFKNAFKMYLKLHREALHRHDYWYSYLEHSIKSLFNPNVLSTRLFDIYMQLDEKSRLEPDSAIEIFRFSEKLCHICNKKVPSYRYCVPMYGGIFRQTYGWYIEKRAWELGLRKAYYDQNYLDQIGGDIPQDILEDIIEMADLEENNRSSQYNSKLRMTDDADIDILAKKAGSARSRVERWIENFVRDSVGYSRVGEGWPSETLLYKIICLLCPSEVIQMHAKPNFLGGLEIDIFLPNKRIAVEYQGIQHFRPIEHWGGEEALKKLRERDKRKKKLCEANGICVIYFYYNEDINEEIVRQRLSP